ncbi:fatty acid desaturase [Octadecabacter ascidiaceicola]|uniref:Fatty acid desaturase n=1 Tax=Octadecabacter ascidiaceicola TaxID=1655543 RepID=A0A238K4E0_9RHOB|nr:fatty acid desaturase [Octadecabacter ascidiaceicola]SMX37264.1 Fatty acid desaturase [Octadecabacter ascidiaceicola]
MSDCVRTSERSAVEWPTVGLAVVCYFFLFLALWVLPVWGAILVLGPAIALHASLTHEVVHGHPFQSQVANAALVFPALTLTVPYARFRATHLAHHRDEVLTDPYDDPETNYLDPEVWQRLGRPMRAVLRINNTLAGRLLIGPLIGQIVWMLSDYRACRAGDRTVLRGWVEHIPALGLVLAVVWAAPLPFWAYAAGAYIAHSILRLRTYLEHQAHELARARTVIVEGRGALALLFLNNNLHVVHHMHPNVAWYDLPTLYAQNKAHYQRRNDGYVFTSYSQVFRRHFWRAKDTVAHPLWRPRD